MFSTFDPLLLLRILFGSFVLGLVGCYLLKEVFNIRFRK